MTILNWALGLLEPYADSLSATASEDRSQNASIFKRAAQTQKFPPILFGLVVAFSDVYKALAFGLVLRDRKIKKGRGIVVGDAQTTIVITKHQVAGIYDHPIDSDRHVDFAWAILVGAPVRDAGGEDRE